MTEHDLAPLAKAGNRAALAQLTRMAAWQQAASLAACLLVTNALSPTGVAPFIYFAF